MVKCWAHVIHTDVKLKPKDLPLKVESPQAHLFDEDHSDDVEREVFFDASSFQDHDVQLQENVLDSSVATNFTELGELRR